MTEERVSESDEKLAYALGRDLEKIFAQKREMDFEDLVKAFKVVETSYVAQFATNQFLSLEAKRRVTELILCSATGKRCPFDTCHALLDDLFRLGFTDLERKGTMCLIFSKYCQDTRRHQEAIDLLRPLKVELEEELARTGLDVYRDLVENTEIVLNELRTSQTETS